MSDNAVLNAGSGGITLATDDIGGVHYQITKVSFGALDTATPVSAANPMPVVQTGTHTVTGAGGTFPVTDSGSSLTVDAPVGTPVFVQLSDGAAPITTLPVSIASVPSHAVTNAGTFAVQAAQSGTWTVQPGNTANTTAWLVTGTGGTFPVTDNAGSLTVDGTVSITANSSVNVAQLAGTTTDTNSGNKSAGTLRVVLATDQPALTNKLLVTPDSVALPANQSVNLSQVAATTTATGNGTASAGCQRVTIASDNTAFAVSDLPVTTGGLSFSAVPVSAASNNLTQAKGTAGQLYSISAQNISASVRYLKIFNKASASVTMGTTACDYQFIIPGSTTGAGVVINVDKGIAMGTGISYAITGGIATTDNTSVGANEVSVLIGYK